MLPLDLRYSKKKNRVNDNTRILKQVTPTSPNQEETLCLIINRVVKVVQHIVWDNRHAVNSFYFCISLLTYSVHAAELCMCTVERLRRIKWIHVLWLRDWNTTPTPLSVAESRHQPWECVLKWQQCCSGIHRVRRGGFCEDTQLCLLCLCEWHYAFLSTQFGTELPESELTCSEEPAKNYHLILHFDSCKPRVI